MKFKLFLFCLAFFILTETALFAFNWPVDEPVVTSTFGSRRNDNFGNGIQISGTTPGVHPSQNGELIFYHDSSNYSSVPSSIGDYAVIEHERKLRTVYSNIELAENTGRLKMVKTADYIGVVSPSYDSGVPGMYFSVIDNEFEQYVNPMLLLNSIVDSMAPLIIEAGLLTESGYTAIEDRAVIKPGAVELVADIYDPCMSDITKCRMAPFKLHLFLNGEEILDLTFESISSDKGNTYVQSEKRLLYNDYYKENRMVSLGELILVPGDSRFEILVSDYAGNETGLKFQVTVAE